MLLLALIFLPVVTAGLAYPARRIRGVLLVGTATAHLGMTVSLWWRTPPDVAGWLAVDPLGLLVLSVVSLLFVAVAGYTIGFLPADRTRARPFFVSCLLGFLSAATLVSLAHHLALVWIGMEATTLSLAPLVFHRNDRRSLEAVWKYLVLSSVGIGLALLGTFFLASAQATGRPLLLEDLIQSADGLQPGLLRASFVFLLAGYGTKMGLAPLHTWKPDTYGEAPSLVGGLMAGALTSCAFLGLARAFRSWRRRTRRRSSGPRLIALGLASLVVSAAFILGQTDLKRMLAYSSVEHMGIVALALGIGAAGTWGAILHIVNNGLIKGAMFLTVGNVVLIYQTSQAGAIRGLLRRAPLTGALLLTGLFAVTGAPPFGLFISELTILGAAIRQGLGWLVSSW